MTTDDGSRDRVTKWLRWIARIWAAPIIVFALLMFSGYAWNWVTIGVADPHAVEDVPAIEALPPIFMFLGVMGLGLAWRWERLGGTMATVLQLAAFSLLLYDRPITDDFPRSAVPYIMSMVIAPPGILFLVSWWRSRKRAVPSDGA